LNGKALIKAWSNRGGTELVNSCQWSVGSGQFEICDLKFAIASLRLRAWIGIRHRGTEAQRAQMYKDWAPDESHIFNPPQIIQTLLRASVAKSHQPDSLKFEISNL
jgi:hypothetical protein